MAARSELGAPDRNLPTLDGTDQLRDLLPLIQHDRRTQAFARRLGRALGPSARSAAMFADWDMSLWRAIPETVGVRRYSAGMTFTCPVPHAGSHLAELVDRARRSHERVVLTEHGQPAAVLISVDELDELQRFQDDRDIALCEAINARNEPGVPHDEFMASLDLKS